jgi:hypothetical protein
LLERPARDGEGPLQGYYVKLLTLNAQLTVAIDRFTALSKPLM